MLFRSAAAAEEDDAAAAEEDGALDFAAEEDGAAAAAAEPPIPAAKQLSPLVLPPHIPSDATVHGGRFHHHATLEIIAAARGRVDFRHLEQKVRKWIAGTLMTPFTADEELVIDNCAALWYLRNHDNPARSVSAKHYKACSPECACQQALSW